jgi:regulator of sigma D
LIGGENREQQSRHLRRALDELLTERKQLLTVFCQAAAVNQKAGEERHGQLFKRLCQLLMDYAALWQFEIHDVLLQSAEAHAAAVQALKLHQPAIRQAADTALDFNDSFDASTPENQIQNMDSLLSSLGESLANRFEAEDHILMYL